MRASLITGKSGAATTASRLGQPDLAIATLNDFVEVGTDIAWLVLRLVIKPLVCANGLQLEPISSCYRRC